MVGLVAAVLAGGLAYLLSSYISVPIVRIAEAMRTASYGDVRVNLPVERTDEVGILASSFDRMAEDLSRHHRHLEDLVAARTAELTSANARLEREVTDRTRAEEELRLSRQELRDLASHLQSVREQERTDVAREVHDELGQALTVLKMDVHWLGQRLGTAPALQDKARAMSKTIDTTVQAVRRISSELRPKLLDDLGLSAAIEWQSREFEQRSDVQCDLRSEPEDLVLDAARSTALFRIFQETLTNVARHAGASRVDVLLRQDPGEVELTVTDDGKGITTEQASDARSLGIVGMRERVHALGGTLQITGQPGRGTTVRVTIPV
jgi:signal transduction histidine kinase